MLDRLDTSRVSYALACVVATSGLAWLFLRSRPYVHEIGNRSVSPPGPKRKFLTGNAHNFPGADWFKKFTEWQKEYGDLLYFEVPGRPILVLNSLEDAEDLLVKRASIWSARPESYIIHTLMGFGWGLTSLLPGDAHNEQRKLFNQVIGPRAVTVFDTMIQEGADDFCEALRGFSGDPEEIVSYSVGAIVLKITYGDQVQRDHGAELVKLNTEALNYAAWTTAQIWLVNVFPIARFLPSWLPGLEFHAYAKKGRIMYEKVRHWAFELVKKQVEEGEPDLCVVTKYLSDDERSNEHLRDATSFMYLGGVDTTSTGLMNFFASVVVHQDVQKKIHQELDSVIGRNRAPVMSDLSSLTYLRAAWMESSRLNPTAPTAVPHASTSEDIWKGYVFPKDTMVIPNVGFMMIDPRLWGDDANEFKPERYLAENTNLPDPVSLAFGFGRRKCPGRYLAERNGLLFAAAALSAYEILPVAGAESPVSVHFTDTKIRRPSDLRNWYSLTERYAHGGSTVMYSLVPQHEIIACDDQVPYE